MKNILKWIGIVVGVILGVVIIAFIVGAVYANSQFKPDVSDRPLHEITADTSPEGVERGTYLMEGVMDCTSACHSGENGDMSGFVEEINEGPISAVFAVPNLTPDAETGLGSWTDAEIARAIREGVDKDGVALEIMPAAHYNALSDDDVAAIIGYLRNMEPVHNEIPPLQMNTVGKMMLAFGMIGEEALQDPITEPQDAPEPGSAEYGGYLISLGACRECHQANLAGGPLPFAEPGQPPAANLTPAGELSDWEPEDFIQAVREGIHPNGVQLNDGMPRYQMTDEDLTAIFEYLKTIPAVTSE
jgi:mono/diheme cytochrome c family protein